MASPELDTVLQMIRARSLEVRNTIQDHRLSYERIMAKLPMEDDITTEKLAAGGVPAEWIDAPNADKSTVLLYLHGGGYAFGSIRTHRVMLAHISRAAGARVLGLDYRLAPEFPFPAPVEDSLAAYRWLLSQGVDPKKIVIGGDSAANKKLKAATLACSGNCTSGRCIAPWSTT